MASPKQLNSAWSAYQADPSNGLNPLLGLVSRHVAAILGDDDQAQEFVIKLWPDLPGIGQLSNFSGWLHVRLRWAVANGFRAASQDKLVLASDLVFADQDEDDPLTDEEQLSVLAYQHGSPVDSPDSSADSLLSKIDDPFIRRVADQLLDGRTQAQIAHKMRIPPATLRTKIRRYRLAHSAQSEPEPLAKVA